MNIHIFNRNAELHASQVTATLYIKNKLAYGPLLTTSKSIQLMLKTIKIAALGRDKPTAGEKETHNSQ